ncbi:Phox homologous domain-containing protein [Echria macrotheca]|uniref:Endosomal/vacuolar adapter protein YPT35 n=1 Tax=Echria macrotheca TaxID=438768 RepID=A0AAJ0FBE7_9PEZI|nr:Phox homologous domain-containing protein [Echria macrotheca]
MASDIQDDGLERHQPAATTPFGDEPIERKPAARNGEVKTARPPSLELAPRDVNDHDHDENAPLSLISPHPVRTPLFADSDPEDPDDDEITESGSEQLTSPSVTSPPYWSAHPAAVAAKAAGRNPGGTLAGNGLLAPTDRGGYHRRLASNMSAESVAAPGAITLQDNECEDGDGSNGGNDYGGRDRNRACWARSVQVRDYVVVNGSTTNIGAFVVWNIRVETLNGSHMNIRKRYSEFDDLRRRLVQTFPGFDAAVPELPPKNFIAKFRPRFLEKRRAGLQYFLNCILLNPEFSGSPVLKEFLFS